MRMSKSEFKKMMGGDMSDYFGSKPKKYNNKKIEFDGHVFDSLLEFEYYNYLHLLKKAGEVKEIELQPEFILQPKFTKNGVNYGAIKYKADFKVKYTDGRIEIVDTKGYRTKEFNLKHKIFEHKFKDLELKIISKGDF